MTTVQLPKQYTLISADQAQISAQLTKLAKDGWKPILFTTTITPPVPVPAGVVGPAQHIIHSIILELAEQSTH